MCSHASSIAQELQAYMHVYVKHQTKGLVEIQWIVCTNLGYRIDLVFLPSCCDFSAGQAGKLGWGGTMVELELL